MLSPGLKLVDQRPEADHASITLPQSDLAKPVGKPNIESQQGNVFRIGMCYSRFVLTFEHQHYHDVGRRRREICTQTNIDM